MIPKTQLIDTDLRTVRRFPRRQNGAVVRRFAAYRVGVVGVAGQHERLTTAAAVVLLFSEQERQGSGIQL